MQPSSLLLGNEARAHKSILVTGTTHYKDLVNDHSIITLTSNLTWHLLQQYSKVAKTYQMDDGVRDKEQMPTVDSVSPKSNY